MPTPKTITETNITLNQKDTGYRGIWYQNQPTKDIYGFKYSGGLGTYCAKHQPLAVYCPTSERTYFCYGGAMANDPQRLLHMVAYFDHKTGTVPRPTILLDKQTDDAHDNPIISLDDKGYIWIFSTSHGIERPSFVHRSSKPFTIDRFVRIPATFETNGVSSPLNNFSYMQLWHRHNQGFTAFLTKYHQPVYRTLYFMTSSDGTTWSGMKQLAAIGEGHYQISAPSRHKSGSAFNMHLQGKGCNFRTNLYFIETLDNGSTWQTIQGQRLALPLTDKQNPALVHDFHKEGRYVYLKDICYDKNGHPSILVLTTLGHEAGPKNNPRQWTLIKWTGSKWLHIVITTSDSNYDMGSLYMEKDGAWRIIAPTDPGSQPFNPGGEVVQWISNDEGLSWQRGKNVTTDSNYNHTYVRRPENAHPDFYALWADGDTRKPSTSSLYFCNSKGRAFKLPEVIEGQEATPEALY